MRRLRLIPLLTALSHVLFAAAIAEVARRFFLGNPEGGFPKPLHAFISWAPWAFGVAIALPLAFAIRSRIQRAGEDVPIPWLQLVLVEEPYFAHWSAAVLSMPLFVIALPIVLLLGHTAQEATLVYFPTLALTTYGLVVRRRWVRVREIEVPISGLPAAFDGYRIAQLSDLHIGGLWPRERAERWVQKVRALDVDLVALTGDYVTRGNTFHADIAELLASFTSRDGTLAVMGNHDYFGDGEALAARIKATGVELLRNERIEIERGGSKLTFGGVDDTWTHRDDVERTTAGHDAARPFIVLAHDPKLFEPLARGGASLVLSGHTHWGQIALPFASSKVNPSRLSYRYHAGIYRKDGATLYVTPGLGTTGPPVRIGAAPEISVLRLRAT